MRPKRYPYSGQKESTFVKADPELVEKLLRNTSFLECLQKSLSIFRQTQKNLSVLAMKPFMILLK